MDIIKRKLTQSEAFDVYKAIKRTPNITGHTVKELETYENVFVAVDGDNLVGIAVWEEATVSYNEILILLVFEKYRGQGIGKKLFLGALKELLKTNKRIFTSSRNPIVLKMLEDNGFKIVSFSGLPYEIKKYYLRYSLSPYRIKEFLMKNLFKKNKPFVYGLLDK